MICLLQHAVFYIDRYEREFLLTSYRNAMDRSYKITPIVRVVGKDERMLYGCTPALPSKSFSILS
jgi:hypothetical protein